MQDPLIALMAQIDAMHEIPRDWSDRLNVTGIIEMQQDFPQNGLPIERGGGDSGDRKAAERRLDELEKSKQVIFFRNRGRRTHWRLTSDADWHYRKLATLYDWPHAITLLTAVDAFTKANHTNSGCVYEWDLSRPPGSESNSRKFRENVLQIAGAAKACQSRGWLHAWSDGHGANGWAISEEGKAFLENPTEPNITWPEWSETAYKEYDAAFVSAKKSLKNVKTKSPGHVIIPLSCGMWPDDSTRDGLPSMFTAAGDVRTPRGMAWAIKKSIK